MNEPEPEPAKPRPKRSAKTIPTLRSEVKAKDKFAAAAKPEADAVRLIADEYRTDDDSALAFVQWLKGAASGGEPKKPATGIPLETWHRQGNMDKGTEDLISDADSAAARAATQKPGGKTRRKS